MSVPVPPPPPRLRVLCLPGWRCTAKIITQQLEICGFQKALKFVDFVAINAKHPAQGPPDARVTGLDAVGPYWQWWMTDDAAEWETAEKQKTYKGVEESLDYLHTVIKEKGPFDGILGYSQGGAMAALVASKVESGDERFKDAFKFVVPVCGFPPNDKRVFEAFKAAMPLKMPSLHCWSPEDDIVPSARLLEAFADAREVKHDKGHVFPMYTGTNALDVMYFFEQMQRLKRGTSGM